MAPLFTVLTNSCVIQGFKTVLSTLPTAEEAAVNHTHLIAWSPATLILKVIGLHSSKAITFLAEVAKVLLSQISLQKSGTCWTAWGCSYNQKELLFGASARKSWRWTQNIKGIFHAAKVAEKPSFKETPNVFGFHFADKKTAEENPRPTLWLGHDK